MHLVTRPLDWWMRWWAWFVWPLYDRNTVTQGWIGLVARDILQNGTG